MKVFMLFPVFRKIVIVATLSATSALPVLAQTKLDNKWHGNVSIGGSYASSNTSSQTLNIVANGTRATKEDKLGAYTLVNYGNNELNNVKTTTAQLFRLGGRYDYNLSEKSFIFTGAEVESNKLQNVDSRYMANTGAGYKVIDSEVTSFDIFTGLGYSKTNFGPTIPPSIVVQQGLEVLFGEESSHQISENTSIKQRYVYYPNTSKLGTRSTLDMSLATVVADGWTMNAGLAMTYYSKPSAKFKKTNSLVTFGFGYKY
jgi:putative salt-induced outer membrane protein